MAVDNTTQIWEDLILKAKGNGIPDANDVLDALKKTKQFIDRKEKLLDFYYRKIEEAFKEGQCGAIIKLSEAGCIIDKETIKEVHKEMLEKNYRIIDIDEMKEMYLIRWD